MILFQCITPEATFPIFSYLFRVAEHMQYGLDIGEKLNATFQK